MARSGITWTDRSLFVNVARFPERLGNAVGQTVDYFSPRVEAYARQNAPWTDRTGNARSGLATTTEHGPASHSIVLAHSVPYGIWLEVRFEGRNQIIIPTIKAMGAQLMATLRSVMSRLR